MDNGVWFIILVVASFFSFLLGLTIGIYGEQDDMEREAIANGTGKYVPTGDGVKFVWIKPEGKANAS